MTFIAGWNWLWRDETRGRAESIILQSRFVWQLLQRESMNSVDLVRRLHQHRSWVNGNLITVAAQLSNEQLRAPFPIGQGSIWNSLVHLYAAEYVWLETLLGDEDPVVPGDLPRMIPGNQRGEGAIASFEELRQQWAVLDERWDAYLAAMTSESLDDLVIKVSSLTGKRSAARRGDILLHLCTHAQYTTAQVMNMLRQAGVANLPEVMLISLARQERPDH
jgi:uncharacterized damage-inducible protein DinB